MLQEAPTIFVIQQVVVNINKGVKMKTINAITTALLGTLFCTSVSAVSLDYRQEYKHESESFASRVKMGHSVGSHSFDIEAKQSGAPFSDWERGDNEFSYSYTIKLDDNWSIQPGMPVTFGSGQVTYKPQIRAQYAFDSGLVTKLRYRHEIRDYTEGAGDTVEQKSKVTGNLDYKLDNIVLGLEGNYEKGLDDQVYFNNGDTNWDVNFKIGYSSSDVAWRPYVEFGNVSVSSDSDERQLRSRIGLTYAF
jgi:hypothetical protein